MKDFIKNKKEEIKKQPKGNLKNQFSKEIKNEIPNPHRYHQNL